MTRALLGSMPSETEPAGMVRAGLLFWYGSLENKLHVPNHVRRRGGSGKTAKSVNKIKILVRDVVTMASWKCFARSIRSSTPGIRMGDA